MFARIASLGVVLTAAACLLIGCDDFGAGAPPASPAGPRIDAAAPGRTAEKQPPSPPVADER